MIENVISKELIELYEPSLTKYLSSEKINNLIVEAQSNIIHQLKNEGKVVRDYCVPFILLNKSNSEQYTTDWIEDTIERTALIVNVNNGTDVSVKLYGSNEIEIEINRIKELSINGTKSIVEFLLQTYKYYKVNISGDYDNILIYMLDVNYYKALVYKTLEIAMRGLSVSLNDTWFEKANKYEELFNKEYDNMLLSYRNEESGEIEYQRTSNTNHIPLLR